MAKAGTEDSRNWILISKILRRLETESEIKSEMRRLMGKIAHGQLRIRYFNADDEIADPRTGLRLDPPPYRYDPLPDEFFLSGELDLWRFSMLTLGERTIHQIEIFVPIVDSDADDDQVSEPSPSADQQVVISEPEVQRNVSEADLTGFLKTLPPKSIQTKMLSAAITHFAPRIIPVRLFTAAYKKLPDECKRQRGDTNRTIARKG